MSMDCRLCALSMLTFIVIDLSCVATEPAVDSATDTRTAESDAYFPEGIYSSTDVDDMVKRRSLFRFGKRSSLMRFGKRGSILRFGKRPSIMRFGKRDEDFEDNVPYSVYDDSDDYYPSDKRGSLMRFGKRSSIMRFGRRSESERPNKHVPWRFGKALDYEE